MTRDKADDADATNAGEMSESEIDSTIADTFPASDPPSWTLGTDHRSGRSDSEPIPSDKGEESDE